MDSEIVRLIDIKNKPLTLGFVGENDRKRFLFDCRPIFTQYPNAYPSIAVKPPVGEIYPAVLTVNGDYAIWVIKSSDLAQQGDGEYQLTFTQGTTIVKTYDGKTEILKSIETTGDAPSGVQTWLDYANEVIASIPETIDTALAEAKASGEFDGADGKDGQDGKDGADGYTPIKGVDYFDGQDGKDGADGYTPVKGVDYFDGQDGYTPVKGVDYFDGQNGADGNDGQDGYTPVKGVDYFDGQDGKDGKDGADGKDGQDGYTPVKGVDYFDGEKGETGDSGVYYGAQQPTDPDVTVWINPDGEPNPIEELREAIENQPEQKNSTATGIDLDVSDENGNVLVRFKDGQISTKKFDSLKIADVKSFGAKGDGTTDDTEALESAMEYAYENKTPVRFSEGTYIIRRPLTLRSNMEIYGEGNAIIKTKATATTTLTVACAEGDETITVADVTGFQIGDFIAISYNATGDAAARHCSVGYITGISGSTITFESAYDSIKTGAVKAHEIGCYVSNACAIFRSWGMLYECKNVYIHNLTLNGNRQNNEWADWFAGCIHIDASDNLSVEGITYNKAQENSTFRDLTIKNSHFDGISDQGNGGGTVENCKIDNPMWHGVHFGTGYRNANVLNNIIKHTQNGAGVFWCAGVTDIIVEGNRIIECNKGCSDYEYGSAGNKSIVNGNIFSNITSYVFDFSIGTAENQGTLVFTDNIIVSPNSYIGRFKNRNMVVFSSNVIDSLDDGISYLFDCTGSDNMAFVGNVAPDTQLTIISGSPTNVVNASNSWN